MIKFICNKLGRDKGIEGFKAEKITPHYKIISGNELQNALKHKLIEESFEVRSARTDEELIVELADVLEVVDGLCRAYGISAQDLAQVKEKKRTERGGFEKGIYLEAIEMDENNLKVNHFRASPGKYPEIYF
jgi:predicted house-cleaning noncanonical NTP pyrophosphatase (MazG superfamily)